MLNKIVKLSFEIEIAWRMICYLNFVLFLDLEMHFFKLVYFRKIWEMLMNLCKKICKIMFKSISPFKHGYYLLHVLQTNWLKEKSFL